MRSSVEMVFPPPVAAKPQTGFALAPMLSGARARGFADGLEWLGLAAALIDDRGDTLHLNAGAVEMLGEEIYLENGRLRAVDSHLDASLREAILETLMTGATTELALARRGGAGALAMRVMAVDSEGDDPCQLLRAVAIFEPIGRA